MSKRVDFRKLTEENCKIAIVSTSHLPELEQELKKQYTAGNLDEQFSQEYLSRFKFAPPQELPDSQSLIVVAMPRSPTRATFIWNGKRQSFILPPTYTAYDEKRLYIERLVAEAVGNEGYRIATPILPLKLLAVHSGIVEYGRNNITYASGMGSFIRLTAVYSDMPCETDNWRKVQMMKSCQNCKICQKACPTGAIPTNRFLLRAEKCVTFHNEKKGNIPFPAWINPKWHNCIVGCIICQKACPENEPFLQMVGETADFDEEETKLILRGVPREELPESTVKKLQTLSLTDYFDELPRNLSVLIK